MSSYKNWLAAGVMISIVSVLTGCGNANNTTGGNTPKGTNHKVLTTSFQKETVTVQPGTKVVFNVPRGWNKQNAGAGDTGGLKWVNPKNSNQWLRILYSGNVGALQNNSGNYDVKSFINNPGITWTSVSSNNLTGKFSVPVGAINNKIIGYGYAQVITSPNPLGVRVDVVAPKNLAQSIVQRVSVITK